jgi:hypothetical protein
MVKNEAIEEFVQAIQQPPVQTGTTYSATVARIDDEGVVWVNLAGSDKETPTASVSTEVDKGDAVTVEWRNNKLYIAGNYSNPSAGTMRVTAVERDASIAKTSAEMAVNEAVRAYEAAEQAVYDAGRAAEAAESAEANALASAQSASSAQQSATSAGVSASQAQAASQAAQAAALGSITTDTLHYLATDLDSGVTTANPPAGHGTWSTTVQTMTSTNKYLWTYHTYTTAGGSSTDTSPVITGTYGERGQDGTSVTILGSYDTLAELQAAHPTGSLGDAYMVGGDLYVWNGSAWENVGQIQGPQGPQGIQGNSITISSIAYAVTATEDAPLTYPYSTVPTVPEGSWLWTRTTYSDGSVAITKAKQGKSGTNGTNGTNGRDGTDGEDGVSVTAVQPQYYLSTSDSSATGGSWSTSLTYVVGKFIWTRDYITYSDNSHSTSTEIYNEALTQSCHDAAEALGLIEEQQEYFWHDSLGAHVLSDKNTVSGTRYRTDIKGAGLEIFELDGQSDVSVAKFGSTTRIGQETKAHMTLTQDSQEIKDKLGNTFFEVIASGEVRTGITTLTDSRTDGVRTDFDVLGIIASIDSVTVNDVLQTENVDYTYKGSVISFETPPPVGSTVQVKYRQYANGTDINYTFGMRRETETKGFLSVCEGQLCTASGNSSHAEGKETYAQGENSHAEGYGTYAIGDSSHAEGRATHADGDCSHAQGYDTTALSDYQTVIGKHNIGDTSDVYAFIIGNGNGGSGSGAYSNAYAVTWDGNVECGDHSGNYKSIFDIFYPVGSYYETSLTDAIPSGSATPTATDMASLGSAWFDPNYAWGGTWSLETQGTFHVSAGTSADYLLGATGGEDKHKLIESELPKVTGSFRIRKYETSASNPGAVATNASGVFSSEDGSASAVAMRVTSATNTGNTQVNLSFGNNGKHENRPPYVAVNRWHRTA